MSKNVAVIIQEDPRETHRPVEALRIALGLVAGAHATTVVLLGEAARLLATETDDIVDNEILEKFLPSIKQLDVPFLLQSSADRSSIRHDLNIRYDADDSIRAFIGSMERTLVF
jgi:hypothetical protein